jgi:hypothetical protein
VTEEDRIQQAIVGFLRVVLPQGALVFAIPNGGHRAKRTAGLLKATGTLAGVSDLFVIVPGHPRLICAEVKTAKGRLSPMQKDFGALVQAAGHEFRVWRSVEDARATLQELQIETREAC